jgi:hypothetical protein
MQKLIILSQLNEETWKFTESYYFQAIVAIFNWKRNPPKKLLLKHIFGSLRRFLQYKRDLITDKGVEDQQVSNTKRDFIDKINTRLKLLTSLDLGAVVLLQIGNLFNFYQTAEMKTSGLGRCPCNLVQKVNVDHILECPKLDVALAEIGAKFLNKDTITRLRDWPIDDLPYFGRIWTVAEELRAVESWYLEKYKSSATAHEPTSDSLQA